MPPRTTKAIGSRSGFIGPLDLALVGILSAISSVLAAAGVSIFVTSTYNTDYILVKQDKLSDAVRALRATGYEVLE